MNPGLALINDQKDLGDFLMWSRGAVWDNVGAPPCFTMRICSVMKEGGTAFIVCGAQCNKHYGEKELILLDHGVLLQCPLSFLRWDYTSG